MTDTAEATMTQTTEMNAIEKEILLRAPRSRVWRAISDSKEFGQWFGIQFDSAFTLGQPIHGKMKNPKYAHLDFEFVIETVQPESLFSYRWHPYALDASIDYSGETMTLVEFHLSDAPEGTKLTVTESGFDLVPEHRRLEAFQMDSKGWTAQVENIRKHVES